MTGDAELVELVGRRADERLLDAPAQTLPPDLGAPPPSAGDAPARPRLVAAGAALTGGTLVGGAALIVLAIVQLVRDGPGAEWLIAALLGVLLAATHWGWVHVAELGATRLDERHRRPSLRARERWLEAIEPYARYEVRTEALPDGSIEIVRVVHRPVAAGAARFDFVREELGRERHDADQPGAAVAERAELLRREAAAQTARERARYELAAEAYRATLLEREDEKQRQLARHAASSALSAAINERLRDPPLLE